MKKILYICFSILIFLCSVIGFATFKFLGVKNGSYVKKDGEFSIIADNGYRFKSWSGGDEDDSVTLIKFLFEEPVFVRERLDLPLMSITTENNKKIESKEEYLNCKVDMLAEEALSFEGITARIKGRGNSTFGLDKKPYKLKFDEKISILGEDKAKEWTLIANHMDYSLMRNYLAYTVGDVLGLEFTTSANFVDVYVNGEYMGVYLLCEQVEVGKNRVDIEDSLQAEETGYLIELDARATSEGEEGIDYFYSIAGGQPYAIKSPDTEDDNFTTARVEFIKDYINTAYNALLGADYSAVSQYLDTDTFAEGYILDELFKTTDVGFSSFYLYKDAGGKLCRGPIWDYDLAAGNSVAAGAVSPSGIYAGSANPWYSRLLTFPEFREAVKVKLNEKTDEVKLAVDEAFALAKSCNSSFLRNFEKWDILGNHFIEYTSEEICKIKTLDGQLDYLYNWLSESLAYLNDHYSN